MFPVRLPLSAAKENLRRLLSIRLIALAAETAGICYAWTALDAPLNYSVLTAIIAVMLVITLLSFVRLRYHWPVTDFEYFSQLLADVAGLTVLLYFVGGSTNPFISYYLVLLTISAATLPGPYTLSMALVTFGAYTLLIFQYQPLVSGIAAMSAHGGHQDQLFNLHILGMWLTFVVSAALISFFVVRMARAIRTQDAVLAESRENTLHDEQLLAVATLAAGTAHELGTPLSTLSVLLDELKLEHREDASLLKDLSILSDQVANCGRSIRRLVDRAEPALLAGDRQQPITEFVDQVLEHWHIIRPDIVSCYQVVGQGAAPLVTVGESLNQAVLNLLNNAGDASPSRVEVELDWDEQSIRLGIRDYGKGIPLEMADKLGKPFVSSKHKGLGLGLFLSHATAARFNGEITLFNHEQGGIFAELLLPVYPVPSAQPAQRPDQSA